MTTIIGLRTKKGEAWIGTDTRVTMGSVCQDSRKHFEFNRFTIAIAGASRLGSVLLRIRKQITNQPCPIRIMESIREAVWKEEWIPDKEESGEPKSVSSCLIIAFKDGRVWWMGGDFSVEEVALGGYVTLGSGGSTAAGALHALSDRAPETRIRRAILAAIAHDTQTGGDPVIIRVGGPNE